MASSLITLLLSLLFLHHHSLSSIANPHKLHKLKPHLLSHLPRSKHSDHKPTEFFEVSKPIKLPDTKPCSNLVLTHDFAFTYGQPPVLASFHGPPPHCPSTQFSRIVLEWRATCRGTQFDRIFGVWLGGVELLRSCTAEPTSSGIVWTVEKDVTRYYSILTRNQNQKLSVYLGNVVDSTYTGVYHVNVSFHFYPVEKEKILNGFGVNSGFGFNSWADLVLPISRNLPLNDGLWFEIRNSGEIQLKEFEIPRNTYRAVLEVYVSFHENDEFWYSNLPNDYLAENGITDMPGNGPFREVVVSLDGKVVGAVWPFTVIYTGGMNPLLWAPISGIGSFDLPSYDIEITPFLGKILDGKIHKFGFNVTNALNVWFVDANLHLWLDKHSTKTEGKLLKHVSPPLVFSEVSNFKGLNGEFTTNANRKVLSIGWVKSSFGSFVTHSLQEFSYSNSLVMDNDANTQIIDQKIHFNDTVYVKIPFLDVHTIKSEKKFPLFLYLDYFDQGNGHYLYVTNLTLRFDENRSSKLAGCELSKSSLKNTQDGLGYLFIENNHIVGASASTQQLYSYKEDGKFCYFRNVSSSDYDIVYDEVKNGCSQRELDFPSAFGSGNQIFSHSKGFSSI